MRMTKSNCYIMSSFIQAIFNKKYQKNLVDMNFIAIFVM